MPSMAVQAKFLADAPAERMLAEYIESLREDLDRLAEQMQRTDDEEFLRSLALRFSLKTQVVLDLQRCLAAL